MRTDEITDAEIAAWLAEHRARAIEAFAYREPVTTSVTVRIRRRLVRWLHSLVKCGAPGETRTHDL